VVVVERCDRRVLHVQGKGEPKVGRAAGTYTTLSTGPSGEVMCAINFSLPGGQISAQGLSVTAEEFGTTTVSFPITGGDRRLSPCPWRGHRAGAPGRAQSGRRQLRAATALTLLWCREGTALRRRLALRHHLDRRSSHRATAHHPRLFVSALATAGAVAVQRTLPARRPSRPAMRSSGPTSSTARASRSTCSRKSRARRARVLRRVRQGLEAVDGQGKANCGHRSQALAAGDIHPASTRL